MKTHMHFDIQITGANRKMKNILCPIHYFHFIILEVLEEYGVNLLELLHNV